MKEARQSYETSLNAAERAGDAATVAASRINLASLAHAEGDLAVEIVHLEAAVDMAKRAGSLLALHQALLNLATLDLYLGRYARAREALDSLLESRDVLGAPQRAQLEGLFAVYYARVGEIERASLHYREAANAYTQLGRHHDAVEARLESVIVDARAARLPSATLRETLASVEASLPGSDLGEHRALFSVASALVSRLGHDDVRAVRELGDALRFATAASAREWLWQTLDARAQAYAAQGSLALSRRDAEAALAILEEIASHLPRDLREVFWNDPRRRALREIHTATQPALAQSPNANMRPQMSQHWPRAAEDRLSRILEITRDLATEHDVDRLLAKVTDHAVALLGAERGLVLLLREDGKLDLYTSRDRAGEGDPHAQFSRSVAETVLRTGEPVVTISARDDAQLAQAVSVHQLMIQSVACVPIRDAQAGVRTIGALYVETRAQVARRFPQEVATLSAFADQAAIAVYNARLLSENRKRAEELAVANAELEKAQARLAQSLGRRTEQLEEARRDLKQVRSELKSHFGYQGIVGTSAPMRRLYSVLERVRDTDIPVLITGESGTGKEVIARAVHQSGTRQKKPFIGINCGAIPANLLESELFGHAKGAFTGAERDRKGLFREAEGGTVLLDEIGELPLKMQAGLLRVLQERKVRAVGATQEESIDVRVIAATNRDLGAMVGEGTFREDLFYRLDVIQVHVPPLRDRREDIPLLVDHFLSLFAARYRRDRKSLTREAIRKVTSYEWPGNVRQLEHVLLSSWLMSDGDEVSADDLELPVAGTRSRTSVPPPPVRAVTKDDYRTAERDRIALSLTRNNWNRLQAAKECGIPRRTFYRRLKEYGLA